MTEKDWTPYAVLGVGVFAVSWSAILIREAEAPALVIGSYRMLLAGLPMGALAVWQQRRAPELIAVGTIGPLVLSAAFLAGHFAFWIGSLQYTSVATSVVLVAAQPLYVALAAPLILGERVERRVWLAILVAVTGAVLMAAEDLADGLGTLLGDVYAILGGMFAAGYFIVGRRVRPHVSWVRYVGTVYPVSALMLLALTLTAGKSMTGYSAETYGVFVLLAVVPQLIGHTSINWSLAYLSAVLVSIAILLEPVITTALAIVVLDELPSAIEVGGGLLVLVGVYLAIRPRAEERLAVEIASAD